MNVEILSIGSEIVLGSVINTNASFISKELTRAGYSVTCVTSLPDDPEAITKTLDQIFERSDLLIVTGGLGPTTDDRTRKVFAEFFQTTFVASSEVAEEIGKRFGKDLSSLSDQSLVPKGAKVFVNPIGTAPSVALSKGKKTAFLLPGVPKEMKVLFSEQILPYLIKAFPPKNHRFIKEYHLCLLVEIDIDPFLRKLEIQAPELEIGIYPAFGTVSVRLGAKDEKILKDASRLFFKEFETYIYSTESPKIEEALQKWMIGNKKTLAAAESFTGGTLASYITKVPDSSKYFLGSLVTYDNGLKEAVLKVEKKTLEAFGAVSSETAQEMLFGLLNATGADIGIALTGIAGPGGGTDAKPVGTAWVAIGKKDEPPYVDKWVLLGDREKIIDGAVNRSLGILFRFLAYGIDPMIRKRVI